MIWIHVESTTFLQTPILVDLCSLCRQAHACLQSLNGCSFYFSKQLINIQKIMKNMHSRNVGNTIRRLVRKKVNSVGINSKVDYPNPPHSSVHLVLQGWTLSLASLQACPHTLLTIVSYAVSHDCTQLGKKTKFKVSNRSFFFVLCRIGLNSNQGHCEYMQYGNYYLHIVMHNKSP